MVGKLGANMANQTSHQRHPESPRDNTEWPKGRQGCIAAGALHGWSGMKAGQAYDRPDVRPAATQNVRGGVQQNRVHVSRDGIDACDSRIFNKRQRLSRTKALQD